MNNPLTDMKVPCTLLKSEISLHHIKTLCTQRDTPGNPHKNNDVMKKKKGGKTATMGTVNIPQSPEGLQSSQYATLA